MHGVQPVVPPPLRRIHSSSGYWRLALWRCPHGPLQSHLQHPPGSRSPPTWSVLVRPSRPGTPSPRAPRSPSPSDQAHLPRRAPSLQDLPLKEADFCNGIQHCHAELQYILHQLVSSLAGVGHLCARDQIRRELIPQGVHRLCHHQVRSPGQRRWWWTCHSRHHSVLYRVPDGDILPYDDTEEVLAVETDLGETTLTFVNVYIPTATFWLRNYGPDFDALLEDHGEQMVLRDFNAHHPSLVLQNRGWQGCNQRWGPRCETTLGSDYLPITVSHSSHAVPSPRKAHFFMNFRKAN